MFFKKSKPIPPESLEVQDHQTVQDSQDDQENQELCLICVDLAHASFLRAGSQQIKPAAATFGGAGWKACQEHYKVITTLGFLMLAGKMDVVLYNPLEEKRQKDRAQAIYEDYDEDCGCQRCIDDSGRTIWYQVVCSQCKRSDCLRTSDHRLACGSSRPPQPGRPVP